MSEEDEEEIQSPGLPQKPNAQVDKEIKLKE
jgi:hypothetical protein